MNGWEGIIVGASGMLVVQVACIVAVIRKVKRNPQAFMRFAMQKAMTSTRKPEKKAA